MENNFHSEISFIDYVHVITKCLVSTGKKISKIRKNQVKNLHNLFLNNSCHNSVTFYDPDKAIFNFLGHVLNTTEKLLLSKGLNFVIPLKNINYNDFMLNCYIWMSVPQKFLISIKRLSKVGSETLFFHHTRTLVKLSRRTQPQRNLMH